MNGKILKSLPEGLRNMNIFDDSNPDRKIICEEYEASYKTSPNNVGALVNCFLGRIAQQGNWGALLDKFPETDLEGNIMGGLFDATCYVNGAYSKARDAFGMLFTAHHGYVKGWVLQAEDPDFIENGFDVGRLRWVTNFVGREITFGYLDAATLMSKEMRQDYPWDAELYLFSKYLMARKEWGNAWLLLVKLSMSVSETGDLQKWLTQYEAEAGVALTPEERGPDIDSLAKIAFDEYVREADKDQLYVDMSLRIKEMIQLEREAKDRQAKLEELIIAWSKIFNDPQEGYEAWRVLKKEVQVVGIAQQDVTSSLDTIRTLQLFRDLEKKLRNFLVAHLQNAYGKKEEDWRKGVPSYIINRFIERHVRWRSITEFVSNMEFGMYYDVITHNKDTIFSVIFKEKYGRVLVVVAEANRLRNQFYHINYPRNGFGEAVKTCHDELISLLL